MWIRDFLTNLFETFFPSHPSPTPDPEPTLSIGEIAAANENFDILEAALSAAGLSQTFLDPGDYTVFAPTDAAFIELASNTLGLDVAGKSETEIATMLVDTLGVATLTDVLKYHVQASSSDVAELQSEGTVTTLLTGATFDVSGNLLIDLDPDVENPEFIAGLTDIAATNGTIQAIDRVLLPIDVAEAMLRPTIADVASANASFEVLSAALQATGLDAVVANRDADFTVFAPTDEAFRALADDLGIDVTSLADADIAGALVGALGADLVTDVLLYHVSVGSSSLAELQDERLIETALPGAQLGIDGTEIIDADPQIENANFISGLTDISTANGEIQAIDRVLIPLDLPEVEAQRLIGTRSDDILFGGGANDILFGGRGSDIMVGGAGHDKMFGSSGSDTLVGGTGNDRLMGSFGNDTLIGGAGDDKQIGGWGRDTLVDGEGNDVMSGGFGADSFDFSALEGDNVVRDFSSRDELIFSIEDFATAQDVLDATSSTHRGLVIETDDASVILRHVYHLEENDFVLV